MGISSRSCSITSDIPYFSLSRHNHLSASTTWEYYPQPLTSSAIAFLGSQTSPFRIKSIHRETIKRKLLLGVDGVLDTTVRSLISPQSQPLLSTIFFDIPWFEPISHLLFVYILYEHNTRTNRNKHPLALDPDSFVWPISPTVYYFVGICGASSMVLGSSHDALVYLWSLRSRATKPVLFLFWRA